MEVQMHSSWRLIFLRHLFAEGFVGCFKAEPCAAQGNTWQSSCCPPMRGAGGELLVPGEAGMLPWHPRCSIPSFQPQQELCWWQEWLQLWPFHAQPWPPGSTSAPAAPLAFSRWAQLLFPAAHLNKEVPWTFAEWVAHGRCCWRATSVFSGQTVRIWLIAVYDKYLEWLDIWLHCWS